MSKVRASGSLDTGVAMERLRTKLYSPGGARELPRIISRLAGGDRSVLESTNERAGFNYYDGVYLTITCSESLPWFNQKAAGLESNRTVFGDYRLKRQRDACRNWPRAPVRPDFFAPVHSTVPTLFISGGRDPVTPAAWAKKAASGFVRARHIIIPWAGHIVDGLSGLDTCYDPEVIRFLETADIKSVDQTCFAEMKPPPFKSIESAKR